MPATVQLNTRIDPMLKRSGDAVLARSGFTSSDAVRALWSYVARHQEIPDFMLSDEDGSFARAPETDAASRTSAGLALQVAAEQCGFKPIPNGDITADVLSWSELRDEMYDAMLDEMEERCR